MGDGQDEALERKILQKIFGPADLTPDEKTIQRLEARVARLERALEKIKANRCSCMQRGAGRCPSCVARAALAQEENDA
jgi:hypothetical protein